MHDYEVWWVDEWDDQIDEPRMEAAKLTGAPRLECAEALLPHLARVQRHERGYGELVILDEGGNRVAQRYPVAALCPAVA